MHDVVIVGARCAGAPLAMLLARAGHDVLVVDRATFPSDTMSTHFIQSPGMARLHHKDPTNADGITDAFRGAELLADAIGKVLREDLDEAAALDDYERKHDEAALKYFDPAVNAARFDLTAEQRFEAFLQARMHNDAEIAEVLGLEPAP